MLPLSVSVMDQVNNALEYMDDLIPQVVYVPEVVTAGAEYFSDYCTSPSFPYRLRNIEIGDIAFWQAVIVIFLQPLIWNCIARLEYYTRILSRVFIKPIIGVYVLALWIFLAGLYRDTLFVAALQTQQIVPQLGKLEYQLAGVSCLVLGTILVFSSFYRLGITGTYLGDYFGILMPEKVTAFPFNLFEHPMYDGSTLIFLGKAIMYVRCY
ncbi:Phosphatidylethanolamine N-methyltransferase [Gracilaria domingensis]|nr:Phosphatidylethanolamine N-methyltransferase [Gracilaria domingensis]